MHSNAFRHDRGSDAGLLSDVGRSLRSAYAEVLKEPLPERIASLLARLDAQEPRHSRDEGR